MFEDKTVNIFSSRDKIRDQMIEYTKQYLELEGIDFSKLSYLSYVVNIMSALTANLLYYTTSTYKEMFLTKAVQKESVLNLSAMLGYTPPWAVPSTASVLVAIPIDFADDVYFTLPAGHKYYASKIVFTQNNSIHVDIQRDDTGTITSTTVTEEVSSGGTRSVRYEIQTVDGKTTLYFMVNLTQQEITTLEVPIPELKAYEFHIVPLTFTGQVASVEMVISEEWNMYDSLFLIPWSEKGFAIRLTEAGAQIFFGNGVIGQQPPAGEVANIELNITNGADGNVISGSINKADKIYIRDYDPNGNAMDDTGPYAGIPYIMKPLKLTVINTAPASGGKDFPTIDEIRSAAIANISSLKRLVTKNDFDNIKEIIPNLPIEHAIHMIKRSDLKSNEINLFTDLIFDETIVPTRNVIWPTDSTSNPSLKIYTEDTIEIDGVDYYSMFNINIDPALGKCDYYYLANSVEKSVTISNTSEGLTGVIPTYARFETIITDSTSGEILPIADQKLDIELNYDVLIENADSGLNCQLVTGWDGMAYAMNQEIVGDVAKFTLATSSLDLLNVENGAQTYFFKMYFLIPDPDNPGNYIPQLPYLNESQVEVIIKDDLSEYMYSQVDVTGATDDYDVILYDVPVIKKSYYDSIDHDAFTTQIYNKIITFDTTDYKMTTDFINLKFSNTTGALDNMKYNLESKSPVNSVNPTSWAAVDSTNDGSRYLVSDDVCGNPWGSAPWNREPPFIAEYISDTTSWSFETIITNDIIKVNDIDKKVIYNGRDVLIPINTIPLVLNIIVWRDPSYSSTSRAIVSNVKTGLINGLYQKFGFDKDIFITEIVDIVQSVPGVSHCKVMEPSHDIFFNYDLRKDLTEQELLEYSPQLVWFDSTSIYVEVR